MKWVRTLFSFFSQTLQTSARFLFAAQHDLKVYIGVGLFCWGCWQWSPALAGALTGLLLIAIGFLGDVTPCLLKLFQSRRAD